MPLTVYEETYLWGLIDVLFKREGTRQGQREGGTEKDDEERERKIPWRRGKRR